MALYSLLSYTTQNNLPKGGTAGSGPGASILVIDEEHVPGDLLPSLSDGSVFLN